ncbi:CD1375 family protein [Desulfitobacterium sp. PCE1]|nr:CD1375 family protein [Desulfitobacterium sp. PCE1]
MANLFAKLIIYKVKKFVDVPEELQEDVKNILSYMGYDDNGKFYEG